MKLTARVGKDGRVTIPAAIRRRMGLRPGTLHEVEAVEPEGTLSLRRRGQWTREEAAERLARMSGTATTGLTTDEIMPMTRGADWGSG